jgi:Sel1 repeat
MAKSFEEILDVVIRFLEISALVEWVSGHVYFVLVVVAASLWATIKLSPRKEKATSQLTTNKTRNVSDYIFGSIILILILIAIVVPEPNRIHLKTPEEKVREEVENQDMNQALARASQIRLCDDAAASPIDPTRTSITGVELDRVDAASALPTCQKALDYDPDNSRLLFEIGRIYMRSKDYRNAFTFYKRAAEKGSAGAQNDLGVMYDTGQGVDQNASQAEEWFLKAAEQGLDSAEYNLGVQYLSGRRGRYSEGIIWLRKAAGQGNIAAQGKLAEIAGKRRKGAGVNR